MAWESVIDTYQLAADYARDDRDHPPSACPNDGTPLIQGSQGTLYCQHDGWQWPEGRIVQGVWD